MLPTQNLNITLSLMSLKKLDFFMIIMEGRPRYFSCLENHIKIENALDFLDEAS